MFYLKNYNLVNQFKFCMFCKIRIHKTIKNLIKLIMLGIFTLLVMMKRFLHCFILIFDTYTEV